MFGLSQSAAAGSDYLERAIKQKLLEQVQRHEMMMAERQLAEQARQADQRNVVDTGRLGLGRDQLGLDREKFTEDTRQFNTEQPIRGRLQMAQTADLERKPAAEREARDFTTMRDKTLHGYDMTEIGASGANQKTVAEIQGRNRGQLTGSQRVTASRGLIKDYQSATKPARELQRQLTIMEQGLTAAKRGDMNAGSQAVLVTFQKILDPTSVVRESEYARSPQGMSVLQQIQGLYPRLAQGGPGVPVQELEKFANLARQITQAMTLEADAKTADYRAIAEANGLDLNFGAADSPTSTPQDAPVRTWVPGKGWQ